MVFVAKCLPRYCVVCDRQVKNSPYGQLCLHCYAQLPWQGHACRLCGVNLPDRLATACGKCLKQPPPYDRFHSLFCYDTPIKQFIANIKFHENLRYASVLGELLAKQLTRWYQGDNLPHWIIPVPLHPKRIQERGFNQSLEIAKSLVTIQPLAISIHHCIRHINTPAQRTLSPKQRKKNIKHAFSVPSPLPLQHVAILDDVVTTGQTISSLATTLRKSGVKRIDVWTCAKTQGAKS